VVGATSKADKPPANAYYIKFNVIEFEPAGTSMTVGIKIIDRDTGKVVTSFTSRASGIRGRSAGSAVFMGRMSHITMDIAEDIYNHIYQK
jgi:hypothetical protein